MPWLRASPIVALSVGSAMDERARTGGLVPIAGGFIDLRIVPLYIEDVIKSFQHKGIESFFKTGSKAGIQPRHEHRLRLQLGALDAAVGPDGMNFRAGNCIHSKASLLVSGRSGSTKAGV
jgi:RelE-like toxin of type II toxin-antitoxin system HigB